MQGNRAQGGESGRFEIDRIGQGVSKLRGTRLYSAWTA